MPRWVWFLPLGVLVLGGALQAFRLGWVAAHLTETDVIEVYAARYLAEAGPGARLTDCVAFPGDTVWLVIRCGRDGVFRGWWVNRWGGLARQAGPGPWEDIVPKPRDPRI